jgi:DNA-binding response OmpR family regulator
MNKPFVLSSFAVATLCAAMTASAPAGQTNLTHTATNRVDFRHQFRSLTPEQQQAVLRELQLKHGLTNAPLSLTPEERRARKQKRIEELRHKEAEGTITPVERRVLDLLLSSTNRPVSSTQQVSPAKGLKPATTNFNFLSK